MTKKYVIAYHKDDSKYWKFLCLDDGSDIKIVYDFRTRRGSQFVGSSVSNDDYIVRDATPNEIDEVMVNKL